MRVLSIGQCGYDDSQLARAVREVGATLERALDAEDALKMLAANKYALVLVNRVFDADGESGVDFISAARKTGHAPPLMLVSDYPEAQAKAVAEGALLGFGKSALGTAEVSALLRQVLAAPP